MLWVYDNYKYLNSVSAGTVYRRQILTYEDAPALKGLMGIGVLCEQIVCNCINASLAGKALALDALDK